MDAKQFNINGTSILLKDEAARNRLTAVEGKIPSDASSENKLITKTVDDLLNYYLKSETYTKAEVEALIGAIQHFHYEVYASTSAVTNPASNVLYLIGPTGGGADKYEEYVYSNNTWVKIGDTSIDLSGYVTTEALNTALAAYTTTANLTTLLAGKQDVISDLASIRSGAAAGATAYQKPSGGIPKTDLASGVQDSLDLADESLQYTLSGQVDPSVTPGSYVTRSDIVDNLTTDDATKILSAKQGKVLGDAVSQLGQKVDDLKDGIIRPTYTLTTGSIGVDGSIGTSQNYSYTSAIPLKKGQKIIVYSQGYGYSAISQYGTPYVPLVTVASNPGSGVYVTSTYIAPRDMQVACCVRSANQYEIYIDGLVRDYEQEILTVALSGGYKSSHNGVNSLTTIATFDLRAGVKYQLSIKASSPTPAGYAFVNKVYKSDGSTVLMDATLRTGNSEKTSAIYDCQEDLIGCVLKSETQSDFEWSIDVFPPIADGAITTPAIADGAATIAKIQDYTKTALLDGFYGGSNKNYNSFIKECYIDPSYITGTIDKVTIRAYSTGCIIRAYRSNNDASWSMVNYSIFTSRANGDIIPITVTSAGDGVAVGTTVGYIIFSDITGFKALANDTGNGQIFVLPLCTKLFTQLNICAFLTSGTVTLEKTTGVSPYEGVYISIPQNIKAVVGDRLQIFFRSIVNCANPSMFDIIAVCAKGKSYPRYWEYTPEAADAGNTATLTVIVRDNALRTIVEKSAVITFVNKMAAPAENKNILCIGASATANGVWVGELKRRLTENTGDGTPANPTGLGLSNITFVGRKQGTTVGVNLEATGGWKVQSYASQGETAFRMQVSGVSQLHIGDTYTSPNGGGVFVLQEINVTEGVGNLRFTFNSSVPTIPASGTLTRISGTGDGTITYSSYVQESFSPFWNTNTNKLDFAKYAVDWCNGSIDVMVWHCGVNDIFNGTAASIASAVNAYKDILRQYHIDFPSGKVIISSVPVCSQDGGMAANYGASSHANTFTFSNIARQYALALEELCADSEFSSFAVYASVLEEFDAENNYPSTDAPVNNRLTSVTEKIGTNGVHPLDAGALQVADGVYRTFNTTP